MGADGDAATGAWAKNGAEKLTKQALLLPDMKMSHHFARMVVEDAGAPVE